MPNKNSPLIEFDSVVKRFPGVVANDGVTFTIDKGTIHSLLGENGAGKTTLMNILYGLYQQDEGSIYLRGEEYVGPREDGQRIQRLKDGECTTYDASGKFSVLTPLLRIPGPTNQKNKQIN